MLGYPASMARSGWRGYGEVLKPATTGAMQTATE